MTQELLTAQEVANLLGINLSTVYTLIKSGELPAIKVGPKLWRIRASALDAYLKKGKESP